MNWKYIIPIIGLALVLFGGYRYIDPGCGDRFESEPNYNPNFHNCMANVGAQNAQTGLQMAGIGLILAVGGVWYVRRSSNNSSPSKPKMPTSQRTDIASQPQTNTLEQELKKAKDMLDQGLIDEEEFKVLKKKIIDNS